MYFKDLWWSLLLIAVGSYFIGNLNFAILISQSKKKDIRKMGSGNPGTLNMSRQFGLGFGVLTLALDILKGAIPALIATLVYGNAVFGDSTLRVGEVAQYVAGFCAVLGHIFPAFYKFKGGKGIATTIGVFLVGEPWVTLIFAAIAVAYILITEIGSVGSFIATTPSAVAAVIRFYNDGFADEPNFEYGMAFFIVADLLVFGIILLTWVAHRQNIKRLLAGEEHVTDWMRMIHDFKAKQKIKRKKQNGEKTMNDKQATYEIEEIIIKSDEATAKISTLGAELISFVKGGKERVWQGNERSWKGHEPILFPMCGSLKERKYIYEGVEYYLDPHGFARRSVFKIASKSDSAVTLVLKSNEKTLKVYPFNFEFYVSYAINGGSVEITYKIVNAGDKKMFASLGSHESFNLFVPFGSAHSIEFEKEERFLSPIVMGNTGTVSTECDDFGSGSLLDITRDKFAHDTLIFGGVNSRRATLLENGSPLAEITFDAPNLLIWTSDVPEDYICIEPWFNLPAPFDGDFDICKKAGLIWLDAGEEFTSKHTVKYF